MSRSADNKVCFIVENLFQFDVKAFAHFLVVENKLLAVSRRGLVREDLAVADMHNAMRELGDVGFMRYKNNGVAACVKLIEELSLIHISEPTRP